MKEEDNLHKASLVIKPTSAAELNALCEVERLAFGSTEEALLVENLLNDPTAKPAVSLLGWVDNKAVGHILFTRCSITGSTENPMSYILAPLAVIPEFQNRGIGGALIKEGLKILKELSCQLVFVLGHKNYYPRFGFKPDAEILGFPPPYSIPKKDADAWMVLETVPGLIGNVNGVVKCAQAMDKPEYWKE